MAIEDVLRKAKSINFKKDEIQREKNGRELFLNRFPIDNFQNMTLEEYADAENSDSFCYWLEFKKDIPLGIGGGNASKFGMYKSKDGNYYKGSRTNKVLLSGDKLVIEFDQLKRNLLQCFELIKNDKIEEIKNIELPIWNMVLIKIFWLYFPDKFIDIGAPDWLTGIAEMIELKTDYDIKDKQNAIILNYDIKKYLRLHEPFNQWNDYQFGIFFWQNYNFKKSKSDGPEFLKFYKPIISFLQEAGGEAESKIILDKIVEDMNIHQSELEEKTKTGVPKIYNQIHWARMYLVNGGYIVNSVRGIWKLTEKGLNADLDEIDPVKEFKNVQKKYNIKVSNLNSPENFDEYKSKEDKLVKFLNEFEKISDKYLKDDDYVRENYNFFQNFIKKENLEKAEWKDFQEMGKYIHSFKSMAIAKANALGKPNHPIEHYRNSLLYLIYGEDPKDHRIRNFCENEDYILKYFGNSAIGEIVGNALADDFIFMNRRDEFALEFLGYTPKYKRGDKFIDKFLKFNEAAKPIIKKYEDIVGRKTDLPINLEVDQFFSYLYENYSKQENKNNDENITLVTDQPKYWLLAPGKNAKHWQDFQENNIIAIGWDEFTEFLGDLSKFKSLKEIKTKMKDKLGDDSSYVNDALACYEFVWKINIGDYVFIKTGRKKILGYGKVISDYYFDDSRKEYLHCRKVEWFKIGNWEIQKKLPIKTLTNITKKHDLINELKGLMDIPEKSDHTVNHEINFWWLNANPKIWNIVDMKVDEINDYTTYNERGKKRRIYSNFQNLNIGDIMIGYSATPDKLIDSLCEITNIEKKDNEIIRFEFKNTRKFDNPVSWNDLKLNNELNDCEPIKNNQGSLFKLTKDEYDIIMEMIEEINPPVIEIEKYSIEKALQELFIEDDELQSIINTLKYKKNIVLQGAPGVGKTYIAKRIAWAIMNKKDNNRVEMIQFHQSYSYEDFIQGYRPTDVGGFDIKNGVFYDFCKKAQRNPDKEYFFIIDEINRGNLSKIFGELMMLIEKDKRGKEFAIPLTYSKNEDERFYLPENLYFIGTMNTADRSLAMVDYALRRRFGFITLEPAFSKPKFKKHLSECKVPNELITMIIDRMNALNENISKDNKNLGEGYRIGHSYFCPEKGITPDRKWYEGVIFSEIEPLLREYWFDNKEKVKDEIKKLLDI
ncbi:AAA family ATPase [Bacteroidota bacterium]